MIVPPNQWPSSRLAHTFLLFLCYLHQSSSARVWESFQAPLTSTCSRATEVSECLTFCKNKWMSEAQLREVCSEYDDALLQDKVVDNILNTLKFNVNDILCNSKVAFHKEKNSPKQNPTYKKVLEGKNYTIDQIETRISIFKKFVEPKYLAKFRELIESALEEHSMPEVLERHAKSLVSHLSYIGFDRRWINSELENFYFQRNRGRVTKKSFNSFLTHLIENKSKFQVLVMGDAQAITRIRNLLSGTQYDTTNPPPSHILNGLTSNNLAITRSAFLTSEIKSSDPYAAARSVEAKIMIAESSSVITASHTSRYALDPNRIIFSTPSFASVLNNVEKLKTFETQHPILSEKNISSKTEAFIQKFLNESAANDQANDDLRRITGSLNSIIVASKSLRSESFLLSVWSSIESILPNPPRSDGYHGSDVHYYKEIMKDALSLYYLKNVFYSVFENIEEYNHKTGKLVVSGFDGMCEKLGDDDSSFDLFIKGISSPILPERLKNLRNLCSDKKALIQKSNSHIQKIEWQILRIYRERNAIIHHSRPSLLVDELANHALMYYRMLFHSLMDACISWNVFDISQAAFIIKTQAERRAFTLEKISESKESAEVLRLQILDFIKAHPLSQSS